MTLGLPEDLPQADLLAPMQFVPEVGEHSAFNMPPLRDRPPSLDTAQGRTDLLKWIRKERQDNKPHIEKWRTEAKKCYRFMAGKQYDDAQLAMMQSRGRAVAAFNNVQKFVRFVSGIQRRAPLALLYLPLVEDKQQQQAYADYLTRTSEWQQNVSNARFHHGRIFEDLLIGGMAWSDQFIDKHKDPGGLPGYKRINPLEMEWPQTGNDNLEGTRWRARLSDLPIDQATRRWPNMASYIRTGSGAADMQYPSREMPNVIRYIQPYIWAEPINRIAGGSAGPKRDKVQICEFQWWEDEMGVYFYDPIQTTDRWLPKKRFETYQENVRVTLKAKIQDFDRVEKRTFWRTFILGDQMMLEMPKRLPTEDDFCFNVMTGGWNEHDKLWYGFVQALINPQEYANRYFNQLIEIIAYQGKGGLMYESDAIEEGQAKELEQTFAKPGGATRFRSGAISGNKVREKQVGTLPEAAMAVMQFAISSMENVTGISTNMFGVPSTVSGSVSGAAGRQKMFAGLLLLAKEFDSFSQFKRKDAEIALWHLKMLADDRLIRVGDAGDPDILRLMRTPFDTKCEVYVEESDMDPTARQVWQDNIMSIAPALIRTGNFLPEIFDLLIMPSKFRNKLKQAIQQSAQQKQQMAMAGLPVGGRGKPRSLEEVKAHVTGMKVKAALDMAKAQALLAETKRSDLTSVLSGLLDIHGEARERQKHSMDMATGALNLFDQGTQPREAGNAAGQ